MRRVWFSFLFFVPAIVHPSGIYNPGSGTGASGGASSLQVTKSGVEITSPTSSMNFSGLDFLLSAVGSTSTITLNPATTDFIHNQSSLQNATLNVGSGTILALNAINVQSSMTVQNINGLRSNFNVQAGSYTGAGLSDCGDGTHALNYVASTGLFGCQAITASGGSAPFVFAVTTGTSTGFLGLAISSPTTIEVMDKDQFKVSLLATSTAYIQVNTSSVTALGPDIDLSGAEVTGTLAAGRFPALTGDITTSAGNLATTAAAFQANIKRLSSSILFTSSVTVAEAASLGADGKAVIITSNAITPATTVYGNGNMDLGVPGRQVRALGDVNISSGLWLNGSAGTNAQVLTSGGNGTIPTWTTPGAGSTSVTIATGTTAGFNGPTQTGVNTVIFDSSTLKMSPVNATTSYISVNTFAISSYTFGGQFVYTVPSNPPPAVLDVWMCAAGGSGGGGNGQAAGSARGGGSGGGGGSCQRFSIFTDSVPAGTSLGVSVGTGAVGGAGGNLGNGSNGTAGTASSIYFVGGTTIAIVFGGGAGRGNQNNEGGGGTGGGWCGIGVVGANTTAIGGCPAPTTNENGVGGAGAGSTVSIDGRPSDWGGASGGAGPATLGGRPGGASSNGGGGGGGSGGCTTLNACGSGGDGGGNYTLTTSSGGGARGTSGTSCIAGTAGLSGRWYMAGQGGGGGGSDSDSTAAACTGGNGGFCGGGGGGGGAGTSIGARGGSGGAGCVYIFPRGYY